MKILPIRNNILVCVVSEETEKKTASGILLPDTVKDNISKADVIAVGREVKEVKVGDVVIFEKFAGEDFDWEDEKVRIITEEDVTAVVGKK